MLNLSGERQRKNIKAAALVVCLYFYIFQPPFFNKIYYFFIWVSIFISYFFVNRKFLYKYLFIFRVEIFFGALFFTFSLTRDAFSGEIVYSDRFALWLFQSLLLPALFLSIVHRRYCIEDWRSNSLVGIVYAVVCLAGVFTLALLFSPTFDRFYEGIQVDGYYELYKDFEFRYRAYGIAENLNFTYGYVLGVFAGYAIIKARENLLHLVVSMILLIGVLYNARIGLAPIFISMVVSLSFGLNVRLLLFSVIAAIALAIFASQVKYAVDTYFSWGLLAFEEIKAFLSGATDNTLGTLFFEMIVLPDGFLDTMIGTGVSIYGMEQGGSDVGYILQLQYAGILFLASLLFFLVFCSVRIAFICGRRNWYVYIFVASVFILNFKGFLFAGTPGSRLLFFLYLYFIYRSKILQYAHKAS